MKTKRMQRIVITLFMYTLHYSEVKFTHTHIYNVTKNFYIK